MPKTRTVAKFTDLVWLYDRLDHLLTVYEEGCMADTTFAGPDETMAAVRERLPEYRKKYGLKQCWPNGRTANVTSTVPGHNTGIKDDYGCMVRNGDIISLIHVSEGFPLVEFRRLVEWDALHGAYVLRYPQDKAPSHCDYLGSLRDDPNYVKCKVVGTHYNLLNIPQGYPPGWTQVKVDKLFAKKPKARKLRK